MEDEQPDEGIVEEEVETEEEIEESTEQEVDQNTDEDSEEDSEEQPEAVEDLQIVEFEGKEYNIPPELKDAIMRQSDYTTKTQEIAEQRKDLDLDRTRFQEAIQLQTAHTEAYTQLGVIDQQLAQFNEIDWNTWATQDPNAAQQAQIQLNQLREQRQQATDKLSSLQAESQQKAQTETARVVEANRSKVEKIVPNWNADTERAVFDFGVKSGLNEQQLAGTNYDPVLINILNKARLFDELQQKQTVKKTKKSKEPIPQATRVKPKKTNNRGLNDSLSTEEWLKRRNAQIAKRG